MARYCPPARVVRLHLVREVRNEPRSHTQLTNSCDWGYYEVTHNLLYFARRSGSPFGFLKKANVKPD
jgi:hypothetical protein